MEYRQSGSCCASEEVLESLGVWPLNPFWLQAIDEWIEAETLQPLEATLGLPEVVRVLDKLTDSEHRVLQLLSERVNEVVTRNEIGKCVWGEEGEYSDWSVDKLMSRLRKKVATDKRAQPIMTVRGKGYRLVV